MNDYLIATASTSDLTHDYLTENHIPYIAYTYAMNDKVYEDDCREETRQNIFEMMRQGTVLSTSQITIYAYHQFFQSLMETGKNVIYMDMSKEMSQSYANACVAAEQIRTEFPNQRFYDVDTRCISGGLGLLVASAKKLQLEGQSFDEVVAWIEANKLKVIHRFTVDTFKFLKISGRVSNATALVGGLLAVKPVMYVPDDGKLTVYAKVQGRKKALLTLVNSIKNDLTNPSTQEVHLLHTDCLDEAQAVAEMIKQAIPELKGVQINNLGTVIGAHCGPGVIVAFYYGDHRQA